MYELNEKLRGLTPYTPVDGEGCVRLDANESFIELPAEFLSSLGEMDLHLNRYPDPAAGELCGAFASYYHINPDMVAALGDILRFSHAGGGLRHAGAGLLHVCPKRAAGRGAACAHR